MTDFSSQQTLILSGIFGIFMLIFAYKDFSSYKTDNHQDYKSLIISLGVLGTFVGIFIGLYGFDTTSIKESVPILLEGLKTAFITSIIGMFLSIFLSAIQTSHKTNELEEIEVLNLIYQKLDKLSVLETIDEKIHHLEKLSVLENIDNKLSVLDNVDRKLGSMTINIKTLSNDISSVKDEMDNNQTKLFEFLEKSLGNVNKSLDEAIETLAKGATEEIIKALESVIQDFNKNLTEQFGDNFKELNKAIKNMILWQANYKNSITEFEKHLQIILDNTELNHKNTNQLLIKHSEDINTVLSHNSEMLINKVNHFSDEIHTSLLNSKEQNEKSNTLIQDNIENLFKQTQLVIETSEENIHHIKNITTDYENIARISKQLKTIIDTNANQVKNLELYLKTFSELSNDMKDIPETMKSFSKEIQTSITTQSKTLVALTDELENTLPQSLGTLNQTLTSLTNKFAKDYQAFLEEISKLMYHGNL